MLRFVKVRIDLGIPRDPGGSLDVIIVPCLEGLVRVAAAQGKMERAARLSGAAAALREDMGWPIPPVKRGEHDRTVAAARGAPGEEAFTAAWAAGCAAP